MLIVDDIVDTGLSLDHFVQLHPANATGVGPDLHAAGQAQSPARSTIRVDYVGIAIPDKFVVGYGIDCNEEYRNLCDICVVED